MKAILSPEKYQKRKEIRIQAIHDTGTRPILTLIAGRSITGRDVKIVNLVALLQNGQVLTHAIAQTTKCDRWKSALDSC
jgi:hypothetical protein